MTVYLHWRSHSIAALLCRCRVRFSLSEPSPRPAAAVHVSGEQRLKTARDQARDTQGTLRKGLEQRRQSGVRVKEEPLSDAEEPMDTSLANGCLNGYPGAGSPADPLNGHAGHGPSPELLDFVGATFRKHFVLTLSELKRLFNLHLASLPPGHCLFAGISDRLLQDTVLLSRCRQILVPVSSGGSAVGVRCGGPGGPVWECGGPGGPVWECGGPGGPVWECGGPGGPVWECGGPGGPVWECGGPGGPVWECGGPGGPVWECGGPGGPVWECGGPGGPVWARGSGGPKARCGSAGVAARRPGVGAREWRPEGPVWECGGPEGLA